MAAKRIRMAAAAETVKMADGTPYVTVPVKDGGSAMRACLHMILKHTADMFVGIVEIVAEKYEIDPDEMMQVITEHPRYKEMHVDPVMHDLGYIVNGGAAAAAAAAASPEPKPPVRRVMKIKPKAPVAAAAPAEP